MSTRLPKMARSPTHTGSVWRSTNMAAAATMTNADENDHAGLDW